MVSLTSPSHRAVLWFLRGGLVAIVAQLVPSQFGIVSREAPALAPLLAALRVAIPAAGFAIGGAVGALALRGGRRTVAAFAAGLGLTGFVLSFTAPLLQGLTGFENQRIVVLFAAASTGSAFALGGLLAGLVGDRRRAAYLAAGFTAGGVTGGVASILPALLAGSLGGWPAEAQLFVRVACSLAGLLVPFGVGGAIAGKAFEPDEGKDRV